MITTSLSMVARARRYLFDKNLESVTESNRHGVVRTWLKTFVSDYVEFDDKDQHELKRTCMYHDPDANVLMYSPSPVVAFVLAFYLLPQEPSLALKIWVGVSSVLKLNKRGEALPEAMRTDARVLILPLLLAVEFDDVTSERKIREALATLADGRFFDAEKKVRAETKKRRDVESEEEEEEGVDFGYYFHLNERWPRGQLSALLSCVDVLRPGAWQRVFHNAGDRSRFNAAPRITNVQWPEVAVTRAYNADGVLIVSLVLLTTRRTPKTSFVVENLVDSSAIVVERDDASHTDWVCLDSNRVRISTTLRLNTEVCFRVSRTGYIPLASSDWRPLSIKHAKQNAML